MVDVTVKWRTCGADKHWCSFKKLTLDNLNTHGVYVIWHGGDNPHVVYVGQGDVATRIAEHRENAKITRWENKGKLFVTWAALGALDRDGVERYLADKYDPLEGEEWPNVTPKSVNSPWG